MTGTSDDSGNLLAMRIHDITVVADPNRHAPAGSDPVGMDGTTDGLATWTEKQKQDSALSSAAQSLVLTWWTGPWPQLHLQVLDPTSTYSCLVHITVDIIGSIDIVSLFILCWALSLLGITDTQWQIIIDTLMYALDGALMGAIGLGFNGALYTFMVVDASFVLWVLALGITLAVGTLVGAGILSEMLREQFGISVAFVLWLAIAIMAFNAFRGRGSADFTASVKNKASNMFRFAQYRLGYSPGTKIGVCFGKFTYIFLGTVIAASILAMIYYWNLAGQ
jgi:hypothetical protein